jgi:hypothetical protein
VNVSRRIAALKREVGYRRNELVRIEKLIAMGEPAVIAFPEFVKKYIADINVEIERREAEIRQLGISS